MDSSTPSFPVHHQVPERAQTRVRLGPDSALWWGYAVYCRLLSSTPAPCPPSPCTHSCDNQKCPDVADGPLAAKLPSQRTPALSDQHVHSHLLKKVKTMTLF